MILGIIFWVIAFSAVLWVVLLNVLAVAFTINLIKKFIFKKPEKTKDPQEK